MVTPLLGSSRPIVEKKNMVEKGQKNLNYSNISDAPRGKLPLYEDYFTLCVCVCVIPEVRADDCVCYSFIKLPHLISTVASYRH